MPFTIEFWMYLTSVAGERILYDTRGGHTDTGILTMLNGGVIKNLTAGAVQTTGGTTIAADTWYNATFVRSASNHHQWYVNGTTQTSANTGNGTVASGTSYSTSFLGDWAGGSFVFNGNIGPVQIYNRDLSANEVLHNYNALRGRFGL